MVAFNLPKWAEFDAEDYQEIPEIWGMLDATSEATECSDDPECLASLVAVHRFEIVELRRKLKPCEWTANEVFDGDVFDGSCGVLWAFPFGGPKENDAKFCPGCGHPVKLKEGG